MFSSQLSQVSVNFYSLQAIFSRIVSAPIFLTRPADDFLSPVSGLVYLISFLGLLSSRRQIRQLALLGILGTFYLLLTPPPSTRYYLPYLPAVVWPPFIFFPVSKIRSLFYLSPPALS